MILFLQQTVTGICVGLAYAMIAMGLILLLRAAGVMNFAQGNLMALGAYFAYLFLGKLHLNPAIAVILAILSLIAVGIVFCCVCFFPFKRTKWPQAMLICTIGAGTVISECCLCFITTETKSVDPIVAGSLHLGSFIIPYQYFFIFGVTALMMVGLWLLFDKAYCGRVMSAAAQNKYAADLLGIPTNLTTMLTFCIVVLMVGTAGWLLAPVYRVSNSLSIFQARAFAALIIGGFGSLPGAIVGGIAVGLIESYSTYFTTTYKDVVVFGALLLVLAVRPQGILGSKIKKDKA